jgi:hypothetical protein
MKLPIKFPSDAEVIAEDAARFRALSPEEQVQELGEMFELYEFLKKASGRSDEIDRLAEEEKERERKAIKEFIARHL